MTLEEAVAELNKRRHRDYAEWEVQETTERVARGEYYYDTLTEFEAVATAEKYQRETLA